MERFRDSRVRRILGGGRGADLLLWLTITVAVFFINETPPPMPSTGLPLFWAEVAAVPLLAFAVAVGRRHPVVAAAVPAVLGMATTPDLFVQNFMVAHILLAFLLGRRTPSMRAGLLYSGGLCLVGLVLAVTTGWVTLESWLDIVAVVVLWILLPALAGRYVRQHDELVRAGWELAGRLELERDLVGERIRLLERSRIAGDMHDSLGHELSLIALQAGALQVHPETGGSAHKAAGELRESAARATERLREIIGVLREDGTAAPTLPPGDTVEALVERATASGMAVTLDGRPAPLPPMADRAAYRVVQEALTNATKHAPGAAVSVRLELDSEAKEAVVTVVNAPPPAGPLPGPGTGGYGLVGLDERVRLAGGRLRAGVVDGGFEVVARLPLTAGAAATPPTSKGKFAQAQRKVRRSMIDAIWMPVAATAVVLLLSYGFHLYSSYRSVLDADVYRDLRIGQSRSSVEPRLPQYQADGAVPPEDSEAARAAPPDPSGTDECLFYRTKARSWSPVYRVCFTDGRLSHKGQVRIARP